MEGYGLYWYCIELIASKVDKDNITFELEHDARIIARNTGSTPQKVEEIMRYFVKIGLFENSTGIITCMKIAKRLDASMTSNPLMRSIIQSMKSHDKSGKSHDQVMTGSENHMQDQIRLDQIRLEKITPSKEDHCPHQEIINAYHQALPTMSKVRIWSDKRKSLLRSRWREDTKRQSIEWWAGFFDYIAKSDFLTGKTEKPFNCDLEWIVNSTNFVKIIEGKYHK